MPLMGFREPNQVKWVGVRPAHRGEQVYAYKVNISNTDVAVYTVPVGKIFFLTNIWSHYWSSGAGQGVLRLKDDEDVQQYVFWRNEDDGTYKASQTQSFVPPFEILAEWYIEISTNNVNGEISGGCIGWVEDA